MIIFDPAPAKEAAHEMFPYVDYVTPNETEQGCVCEPYNR